MALPRVLVTLGLLLCLLGWGADAQSCTGNTNYTIATPFTNGAVTMPAAPNCYLVQFAASFGVTDPDMFTFKGRFTGSNFGTSTSIYRVTPGQADMLLFRLSGTSTNPTTIAGDPAVLGGITTKWDGSTLYFQAVAFRVVYAGSSSNPGLTFSFEIAPHTAGMDLDNDGFIWPTEDCCDTHRLSGDVPSCLYPTKVNAQALEVAGNGVIDAGRGLAACQNMALDVAPQTSCSSRTCNGDCSSTELLQAMDICSFPGSNDKTWGVTSSSFLFADGTGTPCSAQFAVQSSFVKYYASDSTQKPINSRFAVISSGRATAAAGGVDNSICSKSRQNRVSNAYTSKHGNNLETASNCPAGSRDVYESAMLRMTMRAPTNALSFSYRLLFLSQEFPYWVCSKYNDMFLALLSNYPAGFPAPADTNVATAPIVVNGATQEVPLSINIEKFFTVCQAGYNYGSQCNPTQFSTMLSGSDYRYSGSVGSGGTWGAGTAILTNTVNILAGSTFTMDFLIFDTSDYKYQSAAILDAFQWNAEASPGGSGVSLEDQCPTDSLKTEPGFCGCGKLDVDTDGDGVLDCLDGCPNDASKTSAGYCGCGVSDVLYVGWNAYCVNNNQCCTQRGYLGGTLNFAPTEATVANEVTFQASMFLEPDTWCWDSETSGFLPCSVVNTGGNPVHPTTVGNAVPSLNLNFGLTCPTSGVALTSCSSAYDVVNDAPAITGASTSVTGASAAVNSNYLLFNPTTNGQVATYSFSVSTSGTYHVQIYSVAVSTVIAPVSRMQFRVISNGGATTENIAFVQNVGTGYRTLGSFKFLGTGNERIEVRPLDIGNYMGLSDAIRLVSYFPDCDTATVTVGTSSPATRYVYIPAGQMVEFAVMSGSCDADIAVGTNTVPTMNAALHAVDNKVGASSVQILSTGATYVVLIQVKSGSSCAVTFSTSRFYPAIVQSYDAYNNLIVASSSLTFQYPPRNCLTNPAPWLANYEGIARSRGSEAKKSFRSQLSVAVPQTSGAVTAPVFALPPMLVVTRGTTSSAFSVYGPPTSNIVVSFNTAAACSAQYYSAIPVTTMPPSGISLSGAASTNSLALGFTSNIALGYYTVCLKATDTVTGSVTPYDFLVSVIASSSKPIWVSSSSSALQGCPSFATALARDPTANNAVSIDYVSFPYSPFTLTSTTPANNERSVRFEFTPETTGQTSVMLTARNAQGGYAYLNLPINVLGISNRGCPSTSNGLCNGQGTCNCDGSCTCTGRWSGAGCTTYVNNPPVLTTSQILMTENIPLSNFQLVGSDPNGDSFTYTLVSTNSAGATVTVSSSGVVGITTTTNYHTNGQYTNSFVVRLTDNGLVPASATYTVQLAITHVNKNPTTSPYTLTTLQECNTINGQLSASDVDVGDVLTFALTSTATYGVITLNPATGAITYKCNANQHGVDVINFSVSDGRGGSASSTITVTIQHVNSAPVAANINLSQNQDTVFTSSASATDKDGNAFTFRVTSQPATGTLNFNQATGAFTYTPVQYARGTVTFQYVAVETLTTPALTSNTATVSLTMLPVNHAPVANSVSATILEDATYTTVLTGSDVDGDALTFSITPVAGLVFTAATRTLTYTPATSSVAPVTLNFAVSDGTISTPGTVSLTITPVNDPPTFTLTASDTVNEDSGARSVNNYVSNVVMGPADEASQSIASITVTNNNNALFSVQPSISNAGVLTYTPAPNAFGVATITVVVRDNGGTANGGVDTSAPKTSTITVNSVNDAPTFNLQPTVTVAESSGASAVQVASAMSVGPANESEQTYQFLVTGTCPANLFSSGPTLSTAGVLSFTPSANRNGNCVLTVTMKDNGGTANGGVDTSAAKSITIVVTPVNDPPTFTAAFTSQQLLEDAGPQSFPFASNISPGPFESDALIFAVSNTAPSLFSVAPTVSATTGVLSFSTAPHANGVALLTITLRETDTSPALSSNSVVVNITVSAVNDAPTFTLNPTTLTINEDEVYAPTTVVTAMSPGGGADEASQTLAFSTTHNCGAGLFSAAPSMTIAGTSAALSFTLAKDANTGASSCTISLSLKDNGGTANGGVDTTVKTINLTVRPVNDAPTFVAGPSFIGLSDQTASTYSETWATALSAGPADEASQAMNFVIVGNSNPAIFATQPLLTVSGTTATLAFTTPQLQAGSSTIQVRLADNGGTANGGVDTSEVYSFVIQVSAADLTITYNAQPSATVTETNAVVSYSNAAFVTSLSCGAIGVADSVVATLTPVSWTVSPDLLFQVKPTLTINAGSMTGELCTGGSGTLAFQSVANGFGSVVYNLQIQSSRSLPVSKTVTIVVTPTNDAPSFAMSPNSIAQPENVGAFSYPALATAISAGPFNEATLDNQFVWFTVQCDSTANTLFAVQPAISNTTGTLTYTTNQYANGDTTCIVILFDNKGAQSPQQTLMLSITPVNQPPSFSLQSAKTVLESSGASTTTGFASSILAGPPNESYQTLTFTVMPSDASLFSAQPAISSSGTLTFTPATDLFGSTTATVILTDSEGGVAAPQTFTITILPVNNQPSFSIPSTASTNQNAGSVVLSTFATGVSAGPANEAGQTLTWTLTPADAWLFAVDSNNNIQLAINDNGDLVFTPAANRFGSTTVTVKLQDNGGIANGGIDTRTRTFDLTVHFVNQVPTFNPGNSQFANENAGLVTINNWATGISAGTPFETAQTVSFTIDSFDNTLLSSVAVSPAGTLTFTPAAFRYGSTTVALKICDSLNLCSTPTSFTITVRPVNQAPTFSTLPGPIEFIESAGVQSAPAFGSINPGAPWGEDTQTMQFTTTIVSCAMPGLCETAPYVNASGFIVVSPQQYTSGAIVVSVILKDDGGVANGGADTSAAVTLTVNVLPVNDPPTFTIAKPSINVLEDSGASVIPAVITDISPGPFESTQTVSFHIASVTPTPANLFTSAPVINADGSVSFALRDYVHGSAVVQFQARDNGGVVRGGVDRTPAGTGSVSFTIVVTNVDHAPVAVPDTFTFLEDETPTLAVTANDYSLDNDPITVSWVSAKSARGSTLTVSADGKGVVYTPVPYTHGADSFYYIATDSTAPLLYSANVSVSLTITHVNHPPTCQNVIVNVVEEQLFSGNAPSVLSGADPDGDAVTFVLGATGSLGKASLVAGSPQSFRYLSNNYTCGTDTVKYTVRDSSNVASAECTASIVISCVNHPPIASNLTFTMPENTLTVNNVLTINVVANDFDAGDAALLVYVCRTLPTFGALSISADVSYPVANAILYNPTAYKNGVDGFACFVRDPSGETAQFYVTITVTGPSNHAPVLVTPLLIAGTEGIAGSGQLSAVDYDGDALTYHVLTSPPAAICTISVNAATGAFTYTPKPFANGNCGPWTWRVVDARGLASAINGTVSITLAPVNNAPVALPCSVTAYEDTTTSNLQLQGTDPDMAWEGDTISFLVVGQPGFGTVALDNSATGHFSYTGSVKDWFGVTHMQYRVRDASGTLSQVGNCTINVLNVNDPPLAPGGTISTPEETPVSITLPWSDIDSPLSSMTFAILSGPAHGTLTAPGAANPVVTYTGSFNYFGLDSFVYSVHDGQYTATGTFTVNVTAVNDAPVATSVVWTIPANSEYEDIAPGYDVDSPSLTGSLTGVAPTKGSAVFLSGQTIRYTAAVSSDPNYTAQDFFQFRLFDGFLYSNVANITVNIVKSNVIPPTAVPGSINVLEGSSINGQVTATDPQGQTLTYSLASSPARGNLTFNADGSFTYQSVIYVRGSFTFAFRARNDFYSSSTAIFTINIIPVNHAPVAANVVASTIEDTPVSGSLVGSDPDGDSVTFAFENNGAGSLGTATVSGTSFTYTPRPNLNGVEVLRYRSNDGSLRSETATVTITITPVNDAPVAYPQTNNMLEDGVFKGFLSATDVDSPVLTYAIDDSIRPTGAIQVNATTGAFTYTPPLYFWGVDTFAFFANDGFLLSNVAVVTMNIAHVNHPPLAIDGHATTYQNEVTDIEVTGEDVDGDDLTFSLVSTKSALGATLSVSGSTVTYAPLLNVYGEDSFTFRVSDGEYTSAPATMRVTVLHVNQPPTVENNTVAVVAGQSVIVTVTAGDIDTPKSGLRLVLDEAAPTFGSVVLVTDPALSFRYTAGSNAGQDTVVVKISDGEFAVRGYITVFVTKETARPPRVTDIFLTGTENTPLTGKLTTVFNSVPITTYLVSSVDPKITFTSATNLATGNFEVEFEQYYYGTVSFEYRAVDENGAISNFGTVSIVIQHVNHAPVALDGTFTVPEDGSATYTLTGTDVDGDALTAQVTRANELTGHTWSLNVTSRVFTFAPRALFYGTLTFQFAVSDGQLLSPQATVTIVVTHVNHPPTAADYTFTFDENTVLSAAVAGSDVDGDSLTYVAQSAPARGDLVFNEDGSFTYTPVQYQRQTTTFSYIARDASSQSTAATVTLVINPINQIPTVSNSSLTVNEGSIDNAAFLSGYDIEDGPALTFVLLSEPEHGTVSLGDNGAYTYTPVAYFPASASVPGTDGFSFTAYDSNGAEANVGYVTITVLDVPYPPVANTAFLTLAENTNATGFLTGLDYNNEPLTFSVQYTARNGEFVLDTATGAYVYTPKLYFFGQDLVSFSVNNGVLDSNVANLVITVTPVNQPPVAFDGTFNVTAGDSYVGRFNTSDPDPNDTRTIRIVQQPTAGQVRIQGLQFVYSVDITMTLATDNFQFVATDAAGLVSNIGTIYVNIGKAAPPTHTTTSNSNVAGTNIAGGAIGGVIAAVAAVAILFYLYKQNQLRQMAALNMKQLTSEMDVYDNPLYQSLTTEGVNPLYSSPGEAAETFSNPAFSKDTPVAM